MNKNSYTDNSPAEPLFRTAQGAFLRETLGFLLYVLKNPISIVTNPGKLVENERLGFGAYLAVYVLMFVLGSLGMVAYILLGGSNYFNLYYLILQPLLALVVGLVLFMTFALVLKFLWNRRSFTKQKNDFLKYVILMYLFTPLAWLAFPLKSVFPAWRSHTVIVAALIVSYFYFAIVKRSSRFFSKSGFLKTFILLAPPYFAGLYYVPDAAAYVIRF